MFPGTGSSIADAPSQVSGMQEKARPFTTLREQEPSQDQEAEASPVAWTKMMNLRGIYLAG
jgi:hypothetical protein